MSTPNFDRFIAAYEAAAKTNDDRTLVALLKLEGVAKHFEDSLQYVADCLRESNSSEPFIDGFGPTFHKGFRQFDVTKTGRDDMAIWNLLRTGDTCFWSVLDSAPKGAQPNVGGEAHAHERD